MLSDLRPLLIDCVAYRCLSPPSQASRLTVSQSIQTAPTFCKGLRLWIGNVVFTLINKEKKAHS